MTKTEKIKALIAYDIKWAIDNDALDEADNIASYACALFNAFTDKEIDRQYSLKFED